MNGAERLKWAHENWEPLQSMMRVRFSEFIVGTPVQLVVFKTMEEKNEYDDARELDLALAVAARNSRGTNVNR